MDTTIYLLSKKCIEIDDHAEIHLSPRGRDVAREIARTSTEWHIEYMKLLIKSHPDAAMIKLLSAYAAAAPSLLIFDLKPPPRRPIMRSSLAYVGDAS